MTLWYVWTAAKTIRSFVERVPFGSDRRWWFVLAAAGIGLVLLGALITAQFVFRSSPIISCFLLAVAATALGFIILSGQFRAGAVAAWLLIIAFVWGDWLLRKSGARRSAVTGAWSCVSFALGLALLAILGLALGLAGLLHSVAIVLALAALTVSQARSLMRFATGVWRAVRDWREHWYSYRASPARAVLALVIGLIAFFNLLWALAPELRFDALNYQLAVPRCYLEAGRIVDLPYFWHSYFAHLVNSIFVLALALGGQIAAKLIVFATGAIAALGAYALGCILLSRRAALWAAALFYSTPIVSWLSTTAYVDLTLGMFLLACWIAFLRWRESGRAGWIRASGALAGAVVATKLNGAFGLIVIGLVLAWSVIRERTVPERVRGFVGFAVAFLVVGLPWYLVTWSFTGNPTFPLLNGVFRSPQWEPVNETMNAGAFGLGTSVGALVRLPFALTFETRLFDELLPSGGLGIGLVLLPLAFFWLIRGRRRAKLLLAGCTVYLVFWSLSFQYARYYVPILPFVTALAAAGVLVWASSSWPRRLNLAMLWVALLGQCALVPFAFGDFVQRNPLPLLIGRESRDDFLAKSLLPYRSVQYLNGVVGPGERVVGAGVDYVRFYLKAPLASVPETRELREIVDGANEDQLALALHQHRYNYLLVNRYDPGGREPLLFLQPSFLDRFGTLEYSFNYTRVYRLSATEVTRKPSPTTNYLTNTGFEQFDANRRPIGWVVMGAFVLSEDPPKVYRDHTAICLDSEGTLTQRVGIEGNRLYTVGLYTRSDQTGTRVRLRINWLDEHGRVVEKSQEVMPAGREWEWNHTLITTPVRAAAAEIVLGVQERGQVCMDEILFGPGDQRRAVP